MEARKLIGPTTILTGQRLRCKGKYPYEDVVDFMVIESLKDASSRQLLVVSGFMAGRVHCDIPKEAVNEWGAIDRAWMIEHWPTIYPECPVEDVWVMGFDLPELPVPDEQTGGRRMHVSPELSSALHTFSYWIANGTVGMPLLEGIDYLSVCQEEPSLLQTTYAIFVNNLEIDENGSVLNYGYAEQRAAQYLRQYCDENYKAEPPFRYFEVELY